MNADDSPLVIVVDAIRARACTTRAGIQVADGIILVTRTTPPPIDMEIVTVIVSVEHKRVSSSTTRSVILDRTAIVQFALQQRNPISIGIG